SPRPKSMPAIRSPSGPWQFAQADAYARSPLSTSKAVECCAVDAAAASAPSAAAAPANARRPGPLRRSVLPREAGRREPPLIPRRLDEVPHGRVAFVAGVLEELVLGIEEHRIVDRPFVRHDREVLDGQLVVDLRIADAREALRRLHAGRRRRVPPR